MKIVFVFLILVIASSIGAPHCNTDVFLEEINKGSLEERISNMSLKEKIGQLLFIGFEDNNQAENQATLSQLQPGGVILFARNIITLEQTLGELNSYRQHPSLRAPLFVGIDQEGGRVSRLPATWATKFPSAADVGNNGDRARELAKAMGEELAALGFNMDFAPVLDVNSNPANPVIGDRAFASTPTAVWSTGKQVIKGLTDAQVIPVVKHFPGHGDTSVDSHKALPIVSADLDLLESRELKPFHDAVYAGVPVVMIGHILVPALDPDQPASLSKRIINDLLRDRWGFKGVVVTDDLEMGAIAQDNIGEAAVQAVLAGADMLLVCRTASKQLDVFNALIAAAETGRISEQRLNQSLHRILTLKKNSEINNTPVDIENARQIVGSAEHRSLVESLK